MAIIAGVTFGIAFSQVKVGTKADKSKKKVLLHPRITRKAMQLQRYKHLFCPHQLIGMLLACCLSRIITANQYEMV